MHRIIKKALGKLARLPGQSGREEKGAVLLRQSRDYPLHVSYEAHVEHPVDLIQDEELDPFQLYVALVHQVQEPARSGD